MVPASILFFLLYDELTAYHFVFRGIHVFFIFLILFLPISQKIHNIGSLKGLKKDMYALNLERARGIFVDKYGEYYEQAVRYIQKVVPKGERIYVGQERHDRIVTDDVMFYFLANRHSATRFHGWLITSLPVQEEIIKDIKFYKVNYIVIRYDKVITIEPNETAKSSGIVLLDEFINRNFVIEQRFDNYLIFKKKDWSYQKSQAVSR